VPLSALLPVTVLSFLLFPVEVLHSNPRRDNLKDAFFFASPLNYLVRPTLRTFLYCFTPIDGHLF